MKTETLQSKMPEGYTAYGLPIDGSLPPNSVGIRIGLNLSLIIDEPVNQFTRFKSATVWNTETGEKIKIILDNDTVTRTMTPPIVSGQGIWAPGLDNQTFKKL